MTLGEHLDELRRRILLALIFPLPVAVVLYFLSNTLIHWLRLPLDHALASRGLPQQLLVLSPAEAIMTRLKVSIIGALVLAAPWVLWQAWLFIKPGLYRHERRFVHLLLPGSAVLTVAGVLLMYYAMLPLMLSVLIGIGQDLQRQNPVAHQPRIQQALEQVREVKVLLRAPANPQPGDAWVLLGDLNRPHIALTDADGEVEIVAIDPPAQPSLAQQFRLSEYIGFVLLLFLAIVIAFQMPLVVMLLGWMGLADVRWLRQQRKYALLVCGVVSAIITPPDVISMLVMLVPLYGLFELGILLLALAPASAVAEGRALRFRRGQGDRG